jgi:hypothetical protein
VKKVKQISYCLACFRLALASAASCLRPAGDARQQIEQTSPWRPVWRRWQVEQGSKAGGNFPALRRRQRRVRSALDTNFAQYIFATQMYVDQDIRQYAVAIQRLFVGNQVLILRGRS